MLAILGRGFIEGVDEGIKGAAESLLICFGQAAFYRPNDIVDGSPFCLGVEGAQYMSPGVVKRSRGGRVGGTTQFGKKAAVKIGNFAIRALGGFVFEAFQCLDRSVQRVAGLLQ